MQSPRILIQFDCDLHPSVFDAVVAIDSQVDHLLQYANVDASNVVPLVHGAMFTRGPADLKNTAIFLGGSNVTLVEAIADEVRKAFFGPIRVSVMQDGNGCNTTAAAAVLCAARHLPLAGSSALVLGGTGPVGGRVASLLLGQGANVLLASRDQSRAEAACSVVAQRVPSGKAQIQPVDLSDATNFSRAIESVDAVFGCGAAGITLMSEEQMQQASHLQVAIDLNAVPPAGLQGIEATDKAVVRGARVDYGAVGVGGLKMKIHRAAIDSLFSSNDLFLDAEEIFEIGMKIEARK